MVPVVDGSFRQIDEPRSGCAGQAHGQIIGLYSIVTSSGFDDHVVDLYELFKFAGAIILVDQP
jgi:hypothetical protein